jgi:hypothetical protein
LLQIDVRLKAAAFSGLFLCRWKSDDGLVGWAHSAPRAGFDKDAEMTTDNPFATPHSDLAAPSAPVPLATNQPFHFVAAMVVAAATIFFGSNAVQLMGVMSSMGDQLLELLPFRLSSWAGGMLVPAAAVLLLVQHQRERQGVARFRPQAGLLVGFVGLYLLCSLIVSIIIAYASQSYIQWAEQSITGNFWMLAYGQVSGLTSLLLGCLLPLWLLLRRAGRRSDLLKPGQSLTLPSWQVALGVALCFIALAYKLVSTLSYSSRWGYVGATGWVPVFLLVGCVPPFGIVFTAVRQCLPASVTRFAAGRVLACALLLLVMWVVAVVLVSVLVAFAYSSPNSSSLPLYLLPPALLLLALLWPLARWCTGWFFAEQLAQSSPR